MEDVVKDNILINGRIGELEYNIFEKDIDNLIKKYGSAFVTRELIEKTCKGMGLEQVVTELNN
ncbi:hypothetical protein [Clostridium botulinum]|uniref:Uncharacterized protein n=1 Tax=Clostridium botulinum (strain Langeland / NCTC 10281 / Type F) TaxID=441772 RepID=A7GEG0_CLOBL|nr:hypothetical protein [Clostridium botulinum]ABS40664.1 hypothetical protein CLI_1912 [Clostridium botulinum F str. Langeland]ADF99588.1 hypothetical protein CBF_1893 [Clostridium botulinum F str. 230613]KKM42835.1 hypothetical protein VT72_04125 [Clostridium botulinum]MBY6791646.1 hypothetical protein [Clostridium botulinum]MBY6936882.1 hypothetical protein [Clostridium botulinum]